MIKSDINFWLDYLVVKKTFINGDITRLSSVYFKKIVDLKGKVKRITPSKFSIMYSILKIPKDLKIKYEN